MDQLDATNLEIDPRFCSGSWTGFFLQRWIPGRHTMTLELSFRDGQLEADGSDWVGPFTFSGSYDPQTAKCRWTKQYLGKHQVTYAGLTEGQGIWGVWEIPYLGGLFADRGVFHIWPVGTNPSSEAALTELALLEKSGRRPLWLGLIGSGLGLLTFLLLRYFSYQWLSEILGN